MPAALPEELLPGLKQVLDAGLQQSPTILARSIEVAQAEANYMVDRSGLLPVLSANGSYSFTESAVADNPAGKSKNDGLFYGIGFNQPVWHWGALKAQADIGKLGIKIADKLYAEAYRTLALTIRSQYLTLIQKKMQVRHQLYYVRVTESNLALQEARLRDGRISAGDIIAPRLAAQEAQIYLEKAQADYDQARRLLATTAGLADISDESIPTEIPKPTYAPETLGAFFDSLESVGLERSIMAGYYEDLIQQSKKRYDIAKVRLLPKLSLSANYSESNHTTVIGDVVQSSAITTTSYGVSGFWTIFDGFASRGARLSALAAKRLAERNLETFKSSRGEQVRLLEQNIGFSGRLMDLTETRKQLAQGAVRKTSDDVRNGVTSQTTLEGVTIQANSAELNATASRAEFLTYWSEYVSVLGVDPILENVSSRYLRNGK